MKRSFPNFRRAWVNACTPFIMASIGTSFVTRRRIAIFEVLPPAIAEHPIMLFPHRPEVSKGIYEVLRVAQKLVRDRGWETAARVGAALA